MAITEERMLRLISAAETCRDLGKGLHDLLASWRPQAARGELDGVSIIDAALRYINMNLPSPYDLATIEIERRHFTSNRARLYRSRERMAERKEGLPPRHAPKRPKKRPNETGYFTAPHDPTGQAIAEARARVAPQSNPIPRNAEELAIHVAEATRQMEADKAMLASREAHKPKPLPFAPPRTAPVNPYENDGMPEHGPDVTAESLLKAEADARAQANRKDKNSALTELTTEPAHVILQPSEQGIPPETDKAP